MYGLTYLNVGLLHPSLDELFASQSYIVRLRLTWLTRSN